MKKIFISFFLCCFTFINIFATQSYNAIGSRIKEALQTGNCQILTEIMNSDAGATIEGKNDVTDRRIIKSNLESFFSKNRPTAFQITHKTEKDKSGFIMGKLHTDSGVFIIHILLRKTASADFSIYQLRIEKSND